MGPTAKTSLLSDVGGPDGPAAAAVTQREWSHTSTERQQPQRTQVRLLSQCSVCECECE